MLRRLLLSLLIILSLAGDADAAQKRIKHSSKPAAEKPEKPARPKAKPSNSEEEESEDEANPDAGPKQELAPGELPLAAHSAMLVDAKTGDVLYEKNADAMEYPASTTKILTALIVIESGNLDNMVTVEEADTKVEPSALNIKPGETYSRRSLLYALLLKSANDVAMALARDNAGSIEAFAEKMTEKAHSLGADSSHFANPNGLHDPHHFTTARDLAKIGSAAMKNPLFREIVSTPEVRMRKADEWILIRNHNRLLTRMPECIGVKTGYTVKAQHVLVSAATREGKEVISVVMHTNKPGIWDDSKLLLEHGLTKLLTPPAPAESAPATPAPATPPPAPTPAQPTL